MKSNKATVYLLGLMVAAVWGLIIYRVVSAVSEDDTPPVTAAPVTAKKEPLNDYALIKDTTSLKFNYRDPFGSEKAPAKDTVQIPVSKLVHPPVGLSSMRPVSTKPAINWNFIRYSGYIRNPHTKKLIAIMSINGRSLMLSEGEAASEVRLLRNLKDSVKVAYQNKTRFIVMNTEAQ
ncbi:hypothetical protein [Mucilaginibacter lacusdianchii]|uniref:hypothetical protein n=1 Tax=Mucilaginibacter lacusdianchii TaxID=2684211 RepID=UPI00131CC437|nr:hypothetical protein [Mucilaginibacter sp. JXJ CY 39]